MRHKVWFAMLLVALSAACSRETLQRSAHESLQQMEMNRCRVNSVEPCPRAEGYDEYQQKRKELEQHR